MKSSRRGFLGTLAALLATPAIPAALTPAAAVAETSALYKAGRNLSGDFSRAAPTAEDGHMNKIVVQPRFRHVALDPLLVVVGMTAAQHSDVDVALDRILSKFHQPASMEALLA